MSDNHKALVERLPRTPRELFVRKWWQFWKRPVRGEWWERDKSGQMIRRWPNQSRSADVRMTWRDISTAPKDGTRILLWAHEMPIAGLWEHSGWWEALNHEYPLQPTHWCELPPPPSG